MYNVYCIYLLCIKVNTTQSNNKNNRNSSSNNNKIYSCILQNKVFFLV